MIKIRLIQEFGVLRIGELACDIAELEFDIRLEHELVDCTEADCLIRWIHSDGISVELWFSEIVQRFKTLDFLVLYLVKHCKGLLK